MPEEKLCRRDKIAASAELFYGLRALSHRNPGAYLRNVVRRVVDQLSPGARMAAAGYWNQSVEPRSGLGRLCQGSMQTKRGSKPGLLHSRV